MVDARAPTDGIFSFDNSYARLPERLFARISPEGARTPRLLQLNRPLAEQLGIDPDRLTRPDAVDILAGNRVAEGSEPIAMAYAGHQFGNFVPQLGDGRALLLGELLDRDGRRRDIQLKGSGRTPFSRGGDGRAPLGPVLREFVVSEAMQALGIPTTRSLAAVATGERVYREGAVQGAVLTRVAASHIRVGSFEFFHARRDFEGLKVLADHVIARHYPEIAEAEVPALALFEAVRARQADLIARWMGVGFIHGVMNTDNMTISGETIDYGPCAFMDTYRDGQVFSSIDLGGRYAYGNQPRIAHWNLVQLAQALLPLMPGSQEEAVEAMQASVDGFPELFQEAWLGVMRSKLGLPKVAGAGRQEEDMVLAAELLSTMEANRADFTLTFRRLADENCEPAGAPAARDLFTDPAAFDAWAAKWKARLAGDPSSPAERRAAMNRVNPLFIPRNHLVEEALEAAEEGDLHSFETLRTVVTRPFEEQPEHARFARPPASEDTAYRTFCGT